MSNEVPVYVCTICGQTHYGHHTCSIRYAFSSPKLPTGAWTWRIGQRVCKVKGSSWQGRICGFYSTDLTPVGYCVESEREPGSVQIYPASALEAI